MAKIVLVNPQIIYSGWKGVEKNRNTMLIRHALAYLSATLKKENHEVFLLDLRFLTGWKEYEEKLAEIKPDFVGCTTHTCEWFVALEACSRAKKINPSIISVLGGIQATMFAEDAIASGCVDFVCKGEGEISFPKLIQNPSSFPKIFWGEPPNLDEIPFEDRELWPNYREIINYPIGHFNAGLPIIDMHTKRGCPWQCKFCCGPGEKNMYTQNINGKRIPYVRARSVKNVMEEMNLLMERHNFKGMMIHDDEFLINYETTLEFCEAMHENGFVKRGVKWWAAARADMICRYPNVVREMRDAGLDMINIGFESFSDRILKWMNKGTTAEINFKAAKICKDLGLKIHANTILGLPWEDGKWHKEDDIATLKAIRIIKPYTWNHSYFDPIPGSYFHKWFRENNLILEKPLNELGKRDPGENGVIKTVDYKKLKNVLDYYPHPFYKRVSKLILKKLGLLDFIKSNWYEFKT